MFVVFDGNTAIIFIKSLGGEVQFSFRIYDFTISFPVLFFFFSFFGSF